MTTAVAPEPAGPGGPDGPDGSDQAATSRGAGSAFTGTGTLLRFALRRDRVRLPVWLAALVFATVSSVSSFETTYPDAASRARLAETMDSPAMLALSGPEHYLDGEYTLGAITAHQLISSMTVFVAIMSVLLVVRHTRAEEETGRAELLRAGVVGRHAQLAAVLTLAAGANVLLGLLVAFGVDGMGLAGVTTSGSLLLGASFAAVGVFFAGVAAVTVQITPFARGASGMALALLGAAYALRAAGDAGVEALSWLSPIGWAEQTFAYVDDRWWPLLLDAGLALAAGAAAFALSTRRDVGAGLRPPRPGSPVAAAGLSRPVGLALRLQRGILVGFAVGLLLFGMMYGSVLGEAEQMIEDSEELRESVSGLGGSLTEAFASVIMSFLAIVTAAFTVMAVGRARAEETSGRAEALLSTGLSRVRWAGGHTVVALAGSSVVMVLGGFGFGIAGAASAGEGELVWKLTASAAAYAPSLWVVCGIALVLFGWLPRFSAAAWAVPAYSFFAVYLGQVLDMPDVLSDLSPIGHVPLVPAAELTWTPLLIMTVLSAALLWLGMAGLRRRDIETR